MRGTRIGAVLVATCASPFVVWLSEEVVRGGTARFDENVRAIVHEYANSVLTGAMRAFTFIGSPPVLWPLVGLAALLLWRAGWARDAMMLGFCMLGALGWEVGLKLWVHRPRPLPFFGLAAPESYSYPSGHAMFSLCFCGSLAWLLAQRVPARRSRILIWSAAMGLIFLIGLSRVYLGVHYPSDVIAGYAVGVVWTAILIGCYELRRARP